MKRKGFLAGVTLLLLACAATAPALTGAALPARAPAGLLTAETAPAVALLVSPVRVQARERAAAIEAGHPPVVSLSGLLPAHDGAVALLGMR
ncbi:MAG TPA: hypothetical protein VFV15_05450 [Moraxellaceae bacterium]|nr:hypothetical protein [Moraxellaceae bacterium]